MDGVIERLETAGAIDENLTLVGHSFGSCTVSWLIASKQLQNVKQVVLLDPVAVLLSEPDVMVNFLYGQKLDQIRLVASSELFTEYYLRRHFAWYNSELYLEDVDCPLLVCLSGQDTIVNASKVRQEMNRHENLNHNLVYWGKGWSRRLCKELIQMEANQEDHAGTRTKVCTRKVIVSESK